MEYYLCRKCFSVTDVTELEHSFTRQRVIHEYMFPLILTAVGVQMKYSLLWGKGQPNKLAKKS